MRRLAFTLPYATLTANEVRALDRSAKFKLGLKKHKARLAWDVRLALGGELPRPPFEYAMVRISRYGSGRLPDYDGLVGGCKPLLDILVPEGRPIWNPTRKKIHFPHPCGLGIVADDDPSRLACEYLSFRCGRGESRTTVSVEECLGISHATGRAVPVFDPD